MAELVPLGITAIGTYIESPTTLRAVNYLDQQGRMPVRWAWTHWIGYHFAKDPVEFYSLLGNTVGQGSEYFWQNGVGMEGWNQGCGASPVPINAELRRAQEEQKKLIDAAGRCRIYPGTPGYDGHLAALRMGMRLTNVHASTDRDLDAAFKLAEQLIQEGSATLEEIRAQAWNFDHGTFLNPKQATLAAKYGFVLDFEARSIPKEEGVLRDYGLEYTSWVSPAKIWLDAGAKFVLQSDSHMVLGPSQEENTQDDFLGGLWELWPKEWRNSAWPWLGAWITRDFNGKVFSPQHKLDRTTVMKAWTIWPAEMFMRGKTMGSLEPGKVADFIITDKDYFTIPEKEIFNIKTLMTVIGGQVKFKDKSY